MFKIVRKIILHANMYQYDILAPRLAESALPGQFVIVKHGEYGERVYRSLLPIIIAKKVP